MRDPTRKYNLDFGGKYAQTYKEKCKACGHIHVISTQRDNEPEYYTTVFVKCFCGESVLFSLPVN